ncbi:XRE family transcriptional regulator [Aeribacillus pallidus]|uniref:XRE family transcriptional regulator n=1 Tax=Aeribacillus pallidus TaxID=33936 RepID=UPI003D1CF0A8
MKREEIISRLIDEKFDSKRQFAEYINIPPTTLQSILKRGIGKASIDNVISICRGLGITVDDLERMANQESDQESYDQKKSKELIETFRAYETDKVTLPLYGDIAAGALATIEAVTKENIDTITISRKFLGKYSMNKKLFAMKVNGESMNKVIPNRSYVICKPIEIEEVKEDDIVIFSYDGDYSMKRFRRDDDDRVLIFSPESTDKKFRDLVIPYDTLNDLKIYAKVIWYSVVLD